MTSRGTDGEAAARFGPDPGRAVPIVDLRREPDALPIDIVRHTSERFYELLADGTSVAMLVYEQNPRQLAVTHAMVREDRRGHGLGSTLIASALEDLSDDGVKVSNYCASVAGFLDRHPDYRDLIADDPSR